MTELGRTELRRRQKWFVEQNHFSCSKEVESFADLAPTAVLEALVTQRDCGVFQEKEAPQAHTSSEKMTHDQAMVLPSWQVALIVITTIAALTAAGIVIWEAFFR